MNEFRVLILDDEIVIARDLQGIVQGMGVHAVEIATSTQEMRELYLKFKPHLVLCDINLEEKNSDGITLSHEILRNLNTHIIFITAHADHNYLERASSVKPLNYLLKPFDEKQVEASVKMALARPEVQKGGTEKQDFQKLLTESEYRILLLIAEKNTTSEIAEKLFISPKTVENHRGNISRKLNLTGKNNSLLSWALEHKAQISG